MKRFSFVIPAYNSKVRLKNTLEALNYQTGYKKEDYEVIVVDDGSNDNTYDCIKGINRNYDLKYIYLKRCEASSRSRARNIGWEDSGGEIVVFIDSDIIVKNDYLSQLDRCFSIDGDIIVIGTRLMLPEEINTASIHDGSIFERYAFSPNNSQQVEIRHFVFEWHSYNAACYRYPWLYTYSCNIAVPAKWLRKVRGFDENFKGWGLEDIELGYRLYMKGTKVVINSKLEVLHQFHGKHHGIDENKFEEIEKNTRYFLNKHPGAIKAPEHEIFNFFKGIGESVIDFAVDPERCSDKEVIELKDKDGIENLKKAVLEISKKEGVELIINDYLEQSDFDIWIQLLGHRKSTPKYYPMSKRIDFEELVKQIKGA